MPTSGSNGCGGNCYGAAVFSSPVSSGSFDAFHRTQLTFQTQCMAIQNSTTQKPIADAFATCKSCPSDATNFGFEAVLQACVETSNGDATECYKMPNRYAVTVAMSHTEQSDTLEWSVENDMLFTVQTDFKHDKPSTNASADTEYYTTPEEIYQWRNESGLIADGGILKVNDKDVLVLGLGFGAGASASEVMVGTTRTARLGRFKTHCYHSVFETNDMFLMSPSPAMAEIREGAKCTFDNTVVDGTHSPFVNMAAGTCDLGSGLGRDPACISRPIGELVSPVPHWTCRPGSTTSWGYMTKRISSLIGQIG